MRILDIIGVLLSIAFIFIGIHSGKTIVGSFFKKYYRTMFVAAVLIGSGFLVEAVGDFIGFSHSLISVLHHVLLISGGTLLVYAAIILPKEAVKISEIVDTLK